MTEPQPKTRSISDLFSLNGKTALITGASGYLGRALAEALAEAGASVVIASRHLEKAEVQAASLPVVADAQHGGVEIDHLNEESIAQGFAAAVSHRGRLDVLVNNANEPLARDWSTVTAAEFRRQLDNLTGYFLLSRLFHAEVAGRHAQGSLILLGSMYGLVGSYPDAYEGICPASPVSYHAMKGGIVQMTRHLAVYWAKDGVRVNCLSPGPFPNEQADPRMVERLIAKSPIGRMGRPEELKGAIVFLASDASSYLTGQNLVVDGGWTAW